MTSPIISKYFCQLINRWVRAQQEVLDQLTSIVGPENLSTRSADLYTYGFDSSIHHADPEVVVRPRTAEEVSAMVKLAAKHKIPIAARGGGPVCAAAPSRSRAAWSCD